MDFSSLIKKDGDQDDAAENKNTGLGSELSPSEDDENNSPVNNAEELTDPAGANAHNDPDVVPEAVAAQSAPKQPAQAEEASGKGTISQNAEKIAKMLRDSFSDRVSITDVGSGNENGDIKIKAPEGVFEILGSSAAGDEGMFLLNGELVSMGAPENNSFISKNKRLAELFSKYGKGTLAESTANTDSAKKTAEEELSPLLKAAREKQKNSPPPDYSKPKKKKVLAERVTTKLKSTDIAATNGINKSKPEKGAWKNAKAMDTIAEEQDIGGVTEADLNMTEEEFFKDYAETPKSEGEKKTEEKKAAKAKKNEEKKSGGRSRADLLKSLLVDKYKADKAKEKGDDEPDKPAEKAKGGKLAKAASFGEKISAAAEMYDNSKSVNDNMSAIKDKVFGDGEKKEEKKEENKSDEKKPDEEKKDEPKTEEEKKDEKEVKKDPDKAAADAAKELVEEKKQEEKQEAKSETKQEKADRLLNETVVAMQERAKEIAKENNIPEDKKEAPKKEEKKKEDPKPKEEKKEDEKKEAEKKEDEKKEDEKKEDEKKEDEDLLEKKELPVKEMAMGAAAAYNNTIGAISSLYGAKRSKSRKNKTRERIRGSQHILKAVGGLGSGVGALLGSGNVGRDKQLGVAGSSLAAASSGLNVVSSVLGIIGDKKAKKQAKQIADKAAGFSKGKYALSNTSDDVRKVRSLKSKADPERYEKALKIAKKRRSTEKANKLSMAIAEKFNRQKSKASTKGIGDIISGTSQMVTGIFSAVGIAGSGIVKNLIGPIINKGAEFAKNALDKRDKKNEEKEKEKDASMRMDTIKEYLAGKRTKIKAQAKKASGSSELSEDEKNSLSGELTDSEADKIALARLGVSISDMSGDTPASDAEMMEGFEKVIMKRANNILKSYNKDEMLDALMLSHDASAEDIAAALKGE